MGEDTGIQAADVQREDFVVAPIPSDQILDGSPVARSCDLSISSDRALSTNLWDCTAGRFNWIYGADEVVQILEGEVRVTDHTGARTVLTAGSTAHFPAGTRMVWEVPSYVKKLATHRNPTSLRARALLKLRVLRARAQMHQRPAMALLLPVLADANQLLDRAATAF